MPEKDLQKEIADLKAQIKRLHKNYLGLVFEEKPEDIVEQSKTKVPVLKEIKKNRIELDEIYTNNLMIEGDNFLALSVLNYTHKKGIDIIYIDPPYNTGARDWKYNNDYVDGNDAYRHSKWLSFMRNRLKLAKNLLKDDGVLICTIDKNEQPRLALLLEAIFPTHEIVCVTIVHNPAGTQGNNFSYTNEYAFFVFPGDGGVYINKTTRGDALVSALRDWGTISLREHAKTCFYPIVVKENKIIGFGDVCADNFHPAGPNVKQKDGSIYVYPINAKGEEKKWVFSRNSVEEIKEQLFCKVISGEINIFRTKSETSYKTVWDDTKYYANIYGSKLLNNIIASDFPFPKSLYAVIDSIKAVIHDKKSATILDFFAGSGTTGQAVAELNKEDGGNRKFILCTNNENNNGGNGGIAESVCYPRIKAVVKGYKNKKNEKVPGIPSNLFYYQTDLVDIEQIHKVPDEAKIRITYQAGEMIAVREDTLTEVEKSDWWQIFEGRGRMSAIYFKEDKTKLEALIAKLEKKNLPVALYIFSWGKNEYKGEYSSENIRVEDIPEPIIEVYKELNRL
ncbi:MAG: site-specific DNA-methyltransferase [Patescibacteria group bacterium]|nr:site-specific DNA-methyltransferase [Patescibacteria group bacterium]